MANPSDYVYMCIKYICIMHLTGLSSSSITFYRWFCLSVVTETKITKTYDEAETTKIVNFSSSTKCSSIAC